MNPKQRRGVLFMVVAAIGAGAIFFMVASYVASVQAAVGDYESVLRLRTDVPAYKAVTGNLVDEVKVPRRWLPPTAVNSKAEMRGQVASVSSTVQLVNIPCSCSSFASAHAVVRQPASAR